MRPLPSSQRCTSPQVRAAASERLQPAIRQHGDQSQVEAGTFAGLLGRFEAAATLAGLDGVEPDDGEHVGGEGTSLALGLRQPTSPSF